MTNSKFLYSAFYQYNSQDVMKFFESEGLRLKTERGNRVFPESDHSSDVINAMQREMKRLGVTVYLYTKVKEILSLDDRYVPLSLIHIGYPLEEKKANSGYDEKKVVFFK